ncbi:MAG: hypothetical protein QE280_04515 [Caulobacter sp.]|nr:hypothetical protein [Caulobacter sp.]
MDLSRRALVGQGIGLAAWPALAGGAPVTLQDDVATFVSLGEHRTGTPVERRTADWFAGRLGALGYGVDVETFPVRTLLDPGGRLTSDGFSALVFPQWFPPPDVLNVEIEGPLAPAGANIPGCIAVRSGPEPLGAYWPAALQTVAAAAAEAGALALVIGFDEPTDGLFACNQDSRDSLPLPVVIVRPSDLRALQALADQRSAARLALKGRDVRTKGRGVLAHRPGIGQGIVLSTPLTGWFRCGAERGPGIALLLRLAKDLATAPCPVTLLGTGAHELGHLGMQHLVGRAPSPDQTAIWLHLGASLEAVALDERYGRPRLQYATVSQPVIGLFESRLEAGDWTRLPATAAAPGETGDVIRAGHQRVIGLAGSFPGFHTPGDDGRAIDFERLSRLASTLGDLVRSIAQAPG